MDLGEFFIGLGLIFLVGFYVFFLGSFAFATISPNVFSLILILAGLFLIFHKGRRVSHGGLGSYIGPFDNEQFIARRRFSFITRLVFGPILILIGLTTFLDFLAAIFPWLSVDSLVGQIVIAGIGVSCVFVAFD